MKRPDYDLHRQLERDLLAAMISEQWAGMGLQSEVVPGMFSDPEHKLVAESIERQLREFGRVDLAQVNAVTAKCKTITLSDIDDPLAGLYAVQRLYLVRDAHLHRLVYQAVEKADAEPAAEGEEGIVRLQRLTEYLDKTTKHVFQRVGVDLPEWARAFVREEQPHVISTGFTALDERAGGLMPKNLYVVGGEPGSGKTSYMLTMMLTMARRGHRVQYHTYEMSREDLFLRLVSNVSGVQFARIIDRVMTGQEFARFDAAVSELDGLSIEIIDNGRDVDRFATDIRASKSDVIFVDYLNNIPVPKGGKTYESVSYACNTLAGAARESGKRIVLAAATNREAGDREMPSMRDFRDSSAIEYSADTAVVLTATENIVSEIAMKKSEQIRYDWGHEHWEAYPDRTDAVAAVIVKSRHRRRGVGLLYFQKPTFRYFDGHEEELRRKFARQQQYEEPRLYDGVDVEEEF